MTSALIRDFDRQIFAVQNDGALRAPFRSRHFAVQNATSLLESECFDTSPSLQTKLPMQSPTRKRVLSRDNLYWWTLRENITAKIWNVPAKFMY